MKNIPLSYGRNIYRRHRYEQLFKMLILKIDKERSMQEEDPANSIHPAYNLMITSVSHFSHWLISGFKLYIDCWFFKSTYISSNFNARMQKSIIIC